MPASSIEPKTKPPAPSTPAERPPSTRTKSGKLSNPDRVIDPSTGPTKLDLARYYGLVASLVVTHLKARPVSFVRAPGGIQGQLFSQKHRDAPIPSVTALPEGLHPGPPTLLEVPTPAAVMSAAQMHVIEFHTWNAVKNAIEKPDGLNLDLDPGEGVSWPAVQQAAQLVRVLLHGLGLEGWLKTSGGKGLHVVVPLRRQYDWNVVKGFSAAMVRHPASTLPQLFVAKSGSSDRVGKSSWTIFATVSAPPPPPPGQHGLDPGRAYQFHCLGMSWATSLAARNGRLRTSRVSLTWPTHRGTTTRRRRSARP